MISKKQFILNTLLPYKLDPSTCAYEFGRCSYLTEDGKKCAVGKHLREGKHQQSHLPVKNLFRAYGMSILNNDAREQNITSLGWYFIQSYHDHLVLNYSPHSINNRVKKLENHFNMSLPELMFNI